jgi:hypothetical protein
MALTIIVLGAIGLPWFLDVNLSGHYSFTPRIALLMVVGGAIGFAVATIICGLLAVLLDIRRLLGSILRELQEASDMSSKPQADRIEPTL